jgi:hypothetical protein
MKISHPIFILIYAIGLSACASPPPFAKIEAVTKAEAKRLACPGSVLEAGASEADCSCVEKKLYDIGQKPGALQYDPGAALDGASETKSKRDIAIGILRLDAFEHCGLFDPDHIVSKNL